MSYSRSVTSWSNSRVGGTSNGTITIKLTCNDARITVVNPSITTPTVVGVSCAILVFVFVIQSFGTSKIAITFAPIVIIWMMMNLSFGIYVSNPMHNTLDGFGSAGQLTDISLFRTWFIMMPLFSRPFRRISQALSLFVINITVGYNWVVFSWPLQELRPCLPILERSLEGK